jgi:eukaryotic-like serine/threonine-protein kinase
VNRPLSGGGEDRDRTMSFEAGATVGAYRIIGILGSGGVGDVFRVEHTLTKRQEAMKVLAGRRLGSASHAGDEAQRFLREITLQASLNHPNIAAVHHAFWAGEDLVMVMELVEGANLRSLLEEGRIPLQSALNFVSQVLDALAYAHGHSVVHRDVKPANILITPGGVVKLTDFGLAKAPSDPRLTQTGAVMGSVYYMSPEQVRGEATLDARTDIYSLGVVLYEMATGSRPFEADNPFSLMQAHVQQAPAPPREVDPDLPPELDGILLAALAKEPDRRFPSAGSFRDAVEKLRESLVQVGATQSGRAGPWPRSRFTRYCAATVVCTALVTGVPKRDAGANPAVVKASIGSLPVPAPKPAADRNTDDNSKTGNKKSKVNKRPRRRFFLWRALGKK